MVNAEHAIEFTMVRSQFRSIRVAGPDIFILDVIPATVHVEPVSRLGAQESHETIGGGGCGGYGGKWGVVALGPWGLTLAIFKMVHFWTCTSAWLSSSIMQYTRYYCCIMVPTVYSGRMVS